MLPVPSISPQTPPGFLKKRHIHELTTLRQSLPSNLKILINGQTPLDFSLSNIQIQDIDLSYLIVTGYLNNPEFYSNHFIRIRLNLEKFPVKKPEIRVISPIWHPGVDVDGAICEEFLDELSMVSSILDVIESVFGQLNLPKRIGIMNLEALEMMNSDKALFRKRIEAVRSKISHC